MSDFPVEALRDARDSLAPAYRRIADELRRVIDEYDLEPGTRLPSETQLVSRFDVARMTAREALRVLKDEGIVRSEQGRGVFVSMRPLPKRSPIGETLESSESDWRERVGNTVAAGLGEVALVDDVWASSVLSDDELMGTPIGRPRDLLATVSVRMEPHPGQVEVSQLFVIGDVEGAISRVLDAVARSRSWVVSVRAAGGQESGGLQVTRIGQDKTGRALIAVRSLRRGDWPVTTTETN